MRLADLAKARIIVIGDAMIDRYVFGHWSKIGGEGLPVFLESHREDRPGGAANVAAQLTALGCHATLFAKHHAQHPVKTRFFDRGAVFRADAEDCSPLEESHQRAIMGALEASTGYHALVISDYAKGVATRDLCRAAIAWAKARGIPVIVDPKGPDWGKYDGADIIVPNEKEFEEFDSGAQPGEILLTRGARGMSLLQHHLDIPAVGPQVVDVTGAGDTVTAIVAAALAVGFDLETAARLANAGAGVTVGKPGTASCTMAELEAAWFRGKA